MPASVILVADFHSVYKILICRPTRYASRLLKSEVGKSHIIHFACAASMVTHLA